MRSSSEREWRHAMDHSQLGRTVIMPVSSDNVVRLVPGLAFDPADMAEVRDLRILRAQLQVLRRIYLAEAAEIDRVSFALTRQDPGLAKHTILPQIERLEAGIAALAQATQAHQRSP